MTKTFSLFGLSLIAISVIFSSCSKDEAIVTPTPTLYDRVGGTTMVADGSNAGKI